MTTDVKLPRLGQGMESGTIVRWLKREGDPVKRNEPLYELDTDKVTQEVEAEADGVLTKIVVPEGDVEVGATIAVIDTDGDGEAPPPPEQGARPDEAEVEPKQGKTAPPSRGKPDPEEQEPGQEPEPQRAGVVEPRAGGMVKASPLARRMARERRIDLASLSGTGPDGRVLADDVEHAQERPPATHAPPGLPSGEIEVVKLTSVRKTIARRLTEAWAAPVFQLGVPADMTRALALREQLVAHLADGDVKPTVGDVLTRLVGVALMRHRELNATFDGETIERHPHAHVGIAVAAPAGLVVPVVRDAGRNTMQQIARQRADLVGRAREGKLTLDDMQGGTFTISNLGMYGIDQFVAVLNPPQVAILAVGAVTDTVVVVDGTPAVTPMLRLTLTCDHRAIDGADAAEFLRTLVSLLEQPALAL